MRSHGGRGFVCLLSTILFVTNLHASDSPYNQYNDNIEAYAELLRARAEYGKMLIAAKLADSQIQLALAEAELKHTQAAALRVQISAMQYELARVQREDAKMEFKIGEVEKLAACTALLYQGNANAYIIHECLGRLLQKYVPPSLIRDVMKVEITVIPARENFRANDASTFLEDFGGGNMGQLMDFVGNHNMSLVRWSVAHFHFLEMLSALAANAEIQIAKYQAYMIGIRGGTLNIWTLP